MFKEKRNFLNSTVIITILAVVAVGLGVFLLLNASGKPLLAEEEVMVEVQENLPNLEVAPVVGAIPPEFKLFNLEGKEVSLSSFRGQPIVINFWATWCGPCRVEMPAIQSRFEKYKQQGLVILAVDFDEPREVVAGFRDEFGLTFEILLDPGADVQKLYRNRTYPTTFFIDPEGVIQVQHFGPMTEGQIDENLGKIGLEL
jgi:peroxiredoxin